MKNKAMLMKKICSAAIAAAFMLSFAGCGAENDVSAENTTASTT